MPKNCSEKYSALAIVGMISGVFVAIIAHQQVMMNVTVSTALSLAGGDYDALAPDTNFWTAVFLVGLLLFIISAIWTIYIKLKQAAE